MAQFWTFPATLALALACATSVAAQDSAATGGTAAVEDRGGIEATGEVVFENLLIAPSLPLGPLTSTEAANMSVTGESSVVSISAPSSFEVVEMGGGGILTVVTAFDGAQAGVVGLASLVTHNEALSVDIGGQIRVRPEDLQPGEYRGLLVVVAQYN